MALNKLRYKEATSVLKEPNFYNFMYKLMNSYVLDKTLPQLHLDLDNDGCAFTDFSRVHIAPLELLFEDSFGDDKFGQMIETLIKEKGFKAFLKMMLKTELSHEVDGHINCTVESIHREFLDEAVEFYNLTYGLNKTVMERCAHTFFNILEDGRIENSIMYRNPGMIKPFTLLNWLVRRHNKIEKTPENIGEEYQAFIAMMLSYCKTGYTVEGIELCKGLECYENFFNIKDDIDNVVYAITCREGSWYMMDIIKKTGDFIAKCLEEDSSIADKFEQQIRKFLADETQEEKNRGKASNSRQKGMQKTEEKRQAEQQSSSANQNSGKSEKSEEGTGNSSQGDSETEGEEKAQGEGSGEKGEGNEENANEGGSKEAESEDGEECSDSKGGTEGDSEGDSEETSGGDSEGDSGEGSNSGEDTSDAEDGEADSGDNFEGDGSFDDEGENSEDGSEGTSENGTEGDGEGSESKNSNKPFSTEVPKNGTNKVTYGNDGFGEPEDIGFTPNDWKDVLDEISTCERESREVQTITRKTTNSRSQIVETVKVNEQGDFEEIKVPIDNIPLPNNLSLIARKLSKSLEEILESKKERRNLNRGRIDQRNLYKMGVKSLNVFQKKGVPHKSVAVYILRDSSGSMAGEKDRESIQTCAILEEALKKYAAIKIVSFTSWNKVAHFVMRDFTDKGANRSLGFFEKHKASGGNKDGVSIRVATKELKQRNEDKKILFVLSDGLPSDYSSEKIALNDVRCAVEEARRSGIKVIPIMYGNPSEFEHERKSYEFMYQRDILACAPKDLTKTLVPIFCGIFKG